MAPRMVPGGPCRGQFCCCQVFRASESNSDLCDVCGHHLHYHIERLSTSFTCRFKQYRLGPEGRPIYNKDYEVVVEYHCGCGSFLKGEGYRCVACGHDEGVHAPEVSVASPVPPAPPPAPVFVSVAPTVSPAPPIATPTASPPVVVSVSGVAATAGGSVQVVTGSQNNTARSTVKKKCDRPEVVLDAWHSAVAGKHETFCSF